MSRKEVGRKIGYAERELKRAEAKRRKLENRYMELRCSGAPENILIRYKLELKGVMDYINELRLRL